ncbi:MAG TPA: LysE family transporter [Thermoanaerobacterales bacterium]|nr:LysE family transporter [Thermoanaerobacterales bacterium]
MNLSSIFITAFLVGLSGAMMPGPLVTIALNESLKSGLGANLLVSSGHALMEALLVLVLALGLGSMLNQPFIMGFIGIIGSLFLFKMAFDMVRDVHLGKISLDMKASPGSSRNFGPGLSGIFATISNPYWFLWWVTIGSNYVALSLKNGMAGILSFYFGHILSDFSWLFIVGTMVVTGKKFISDTVYRSLILIMGVFLGILSMYFLYSGIKFLS